MKKFNILFALWLFELVSIVVGTVGCSDSPPPNEQHKKFIVTNVRFVGVENKFFYNVAVMDDDGHEEILQISLEKIEIDVKPGNPPWLDRRTTHTQPGRYFDTLHISSHTDIKYNNSDF